ncbi:hypothetical protein T492DRAFT_32081 [Pavlovales sp. CCMP2436]|nr:hypothetical protein T492DRAFT_32081 [Pavlovales sp. CCMP2436]
MRDEGVPGDTRLTDRPASRIPADDSESTLSDVHVRTGGIPAADSMMNLPEDLAVADAPPDVMPETLVQEDAFVLALAAVGVLDVAVDDKGPPQVLADDLVLDQVEHDQLEEESVDGDSTASGPSSESRLSNSTGVAHAVSQEGRPSLLRPEPIDAQNDVARADVAEQAYAAPTLRKAATKSASKGEGGEAPASPRLFSAAALGSRALDLGHSLIDLSMLLARWVLGEASYSVLLLPSVIAFVAHADEPTRSRWQVWVLRPLYALVLGRVASAVLFLIAHNPWSLELLPAQMTLFIEAFRGWQSVCICYLVITTAFYFGPRSVLGAERDAWDELQGVYFLAGVNGWLAALALTRGLLDVLTQRMLIDLKDGHFEERVQSALLSMRCMRYFVCVCVCVCVFIMIRVQSALLSMRCMRYFFYNSSSE